MDQISVRRVPRVALAVAAAASVIALTASYVSTSAHATERVKAAKAGGEMTLGFVYKLPNPYFEAMTGAVKSWAKANHIHLLVGGGQSPTDINGQISAVQTMISEGAKAIIIAPQGTQLIPTLNRAVAQHIPVLLVDTDLPTWKKKTTYIGTNNYAGAVLAGKYIRAHLKRGDSIAIESGIPGVPTLDQRVQGVVNALKGSGISVVANLPTQCVEPQGVSVTDDILTAHPDIKAIYYACSPPVFGGLEALAHRNLSKRLVIVGFDGDPQEFKDIRAGTETATVAQFPQKMGVEALQLALKALHGKAVPKSIDSGQVLVTKSAAAHYHSWL